MKRLYVMIVLCLISVMSISAQSQWDTLKDEVDKAFEEKNYVEAVKGLKILAYDAHDTDAMKFLAKCYLGVFGVKQDNKKRIELLEMAADGGDVEAMLYLLREYYQKNHKKYMSVMDRMDNEVKKGNTQAMDVLAHMYEEGDGAPKEPILASHYRQKYNMANVGKIFSELHNQGASNNTPSSSAPTTSQAKSSAKRNNSGIMTLKDHVFGFVSTPPSQCTISSVNEELYRKYGFTLKEYSSSLIWKDNQEPVGFDFVLNGKKIKYAFFEHLITSRFWSYNIYELKKSTTFKASVEYIKQLQRELEAEGYNFKIVTSSNKDYCVRSKNKDTAIELNCSEDRLVKYKDSWKIEIIFYSGHLKE